MRMITSDTSIATTSNKIIVGAYFDDSRAGSVYVYDANNLSATPTKLTAFDGAANDYFGRSVFATDDKIIVGAYGDDDNGSSSGSVYVYDINNLSATPTKLTAFDRALRMIFSVLQFLLLRIRSLLARWVTILILDQSMFMVPTTYLLDRQN